MRERFDTSFPVYGLAMEGRTIWAVGSHGFQRLRFGQGPGLVTLGNAVEVDKTLMSVDAGPTGVWAVGGGDGGDPYGELLRLGRKRIARRISLPDASPYDVLALGGTVWVADSGGERLLVVYPDDVTAPGEPRIEELSLVGEQPVSVVHTKAHVFALSSGSGGRSWARIDPGTGEPELIVEAGRCPIDIAVGAGSVWVADYCKDVVRRFSLDGELFAEIEVGNRPSALTFEYRTLWVGNGGAVSSIMPMTNKVTGRYPVTGRVHALLVERGSLLVAHKNFVTRILLEL